LQNLLEEVELWYFVDTEVAPPIDLKDLVEHTKKSIKVKQIILDMVKDHLIPHITKKKMVKEMFDAMVMLYRSVNVSHKMLLKNKLIGTPMGKIDTMVSYLMKITELRDQFALIGEEVDESDLIWITLNEFGPLCHHFI
jgi:hypothetical protein